MTELTGQLTWPFPTPGPLLGTAYRDLYLAAEGDDNQKALIGDHTLLPKPWDPPTCHNPQLRAELWTWLDQVVVWVNHEYLWDPDGTIPPCWPQHPHLVHEIAVLADQRRRAGIDPTSSALEEWHRYGVPGFLERLKTRTKNGCDEHHSAWPADARNARLIGRAAASGRALMFAADVDTLGVSVSETSSRGMHLVGQTTGDLVDPATGEVF